MPGHYRWSSYRHHAQGKDDRLVTEDHSYTSLKKIKDARLVAYKDLFRTHIDSDYLKSICVAWQTGTPLGNDDFRKKASENSKQRLVRIGAGGRMPLLKGSDLGCRNSLILG